MYENIFFHIRINFSKIGSGIVHKYLNVEEFTRIRFLNIFSANELKILCSTYQMFLSYSHKDLGVSIRPHSRMKITTNIISTFYSYITICWNVNKAAITCLIAMKKRKDKKECVVFFPSIAIKFEKVVNTYFIDDKYLRDPPNLCIKARTWNLYMKFCTSHGQVPSPM